MLPFTRPSIGEDEISAVVEVLKSGWITTGPKVVEFENALASYLGGSVYVRAFSSCTAALEAALIVANVGIGDEVIVPAISFAASANVVLKVGARPVFVDVDLISRNISIEAIEKAYTPKTKAIISVHFAGRSVDMDSIYAFARAKNITVIEDAAHAIGTAYNGKPIGASGNQVCFSFHPNKNITSIEGGAIASSDMKVIRRLERLRFHGIEKNEFGEVSMVELGAKANLPDVNAALGLVQLKKLDAFNARRKQLAQTYLNKLIDHPALIKPEDSAGHSWHMFCVCIDYVALGISKQNVMEYFRKRNINLGQHYPAIHLFPLYRSFGYGPGDFPNAELIGTQTFSLPLFPQMTESDLELVCSTLNELLLGHK